MKTSQIQKNIPTDWQQVLLADVCKVNQGLQIPISERFAVPCENRKKYITTQYLNGKSEPEYIEGFSDSVVCNKDEILMTRTGNSGIVVTGVEGVFHNNFFKVKPYKNILGKLLVYNLLSPYIQYKLLKLAGASTIPDLNHGDFYSIDLLLPPLPEQNRIVRVLETWDQVIYKLKRKIEIKKEIKKGLMQELLTGDTQLKGFDKEWQETKLNDLGHFSKGMGILKDEVTETGHNAIRYGELYTKYNFEIKKIFSHIPDNVIPLTKKIKYGDIIFAGSGETIDEIGKSAVYLLDEDCYAGGDTIIFTPTKAIGLFLSYFLNTGEARRRLRELGQGQAVVHIYKRDIEKLKFKFPPETEQVAIANILTTANQEIAELQKKLSIIKEQKKYLLNNLITGTIRTPESLSIPK